MYEIMISLDPDKGVKDVTLQTSEKDRGSLEPMQFYLNIRKDIQRFKKSIAKTLKGIDLK